MRFSLHILVVIVFMSPLMVMAQVAEINERLAIAETLLKDKNYDSAYFHVQKTLALKANCVPCLLLRADIYTATQAYDRAVTDYSSVLFLEENHLNALWNRAFVYHEMEQFAKAEADLISYLQAPKGETKEILLKIDPRDGMTMGFTTHQSERADEVYLLLASIASKQGNILKTKEYYKQGSEANPNNVELALEYAYLEWHMGDKRLAEDKIKAIIGSKYKLDKSSHSKLEQLVKETKNDVLLFQIQINQSSESVETLANQAIEWMMDENYEAALNHWEKVIEQENDRAEYWLNKGICHYQLEQFDEARKSLKKSTEVKVPEAQSYLYLGLVAMKEKKWHEAERQFGMAILYRTDYAEAFYNRALAAYNGGKKSQACEDIIKAESLNLKANPRFKQKACNNG